MLQDGVYNKAIYWPEELQIKITAYQQFKYFLRPTRHYFSRCKKWHLPFNCYKALMYGEVIEAEIWNNCLMKMVTRLPDRKNKRISLCAVIIPCPGAGEAIVKTVWLNKTDDNHSTLNKKNYILEKVLIKVDEGDRI